MSLPILPDSAPFTGEQRAWLNGFFAGLLGLSEAAAPSSTATSPNGAAAAAPQVAADDEVFAWHDSTLSIDERLQLSADRPLELQLMSAMAQLNCGACGYLCQSYGQALASGEEKDITRCSPGGSDTAKALKRILQNKPAVAASAAAATVPTSAPSAAVVPGTHRNHPLPAKLLDSRRLTHPDSAKDTRHVVINLAGSGLTYEPGDSLGVMPENAPELVDGILATLGAAGGNTPADAGKEAAVDLREVLTHEYSLSRVRPALVEAMAVAAAHTVDRESLQALLTQEDELQSLDVLELLERYPRVRLEISALLSGLAKLQPRLYSISSSQKAVRDEVHLTVGVVRWEARGRWRNGVASHFLGVRCGPEQPVRIFVQPSRFRLPTDSQTPVIMVGPGTGIAPFRAFLQERQATGAIGRNWLLFGNQHFDYDYLYRDELERFLDAGVLTRLDLAFSRDRAQKVYVQHLMLEQAAELWNWLEQGAHFYVCGDAKHMAADVHDALLKVVEMQGGMTETDAAAYAQSLTKSRRYQRDVY